MNKEISSKFCSEESIKRLIEGFLVTGFLVFFDQITKYLVKEYFSYHYLSFIPCFLNIRYVTNTGAIWGIFSGGNKWLVAISFIVLGMMMKMWNFFFYGSKVKFYSGIILLSGIVGNLIDRIKYGYVIDFIDFYFLNWHFPAFNFADVYICTGVGLYLLDHLMYPQQNKIEKIWN